MNVKVKSDVCWKACQACVEEYKVDPAHARFYVRWAESFLDQLPDRRWTGWKNINH